MNLNLYLYLYFNDWQFTKKKIQKSEENLKGELQTISNTGNVKVNVKFKLKRILYGKRCVGLLVVGPKKKKIVRTLEKNTRIKS